MTNKRDVIRLNFSENDPRHRVVKSFIESISGDKRSISDSKIKRIQGEVTIDLLYSLASGTFVAEHYGLNNPIALHTPTPQALEQSDPNGNGADQTGPSIIKPQRNASDHTNATSGFIPATPPHENNSSQPRSDVIHKEPASASMIDSDLLSITAVSTPANREDTSKLNPATPIVEISDVDPADLMHGLFENGG